jgi:uncharacterized protein YfaS (alpha-2-macroglobulin family)
MFSRVFQLLSKKPYLLIISIIVLVSLIFSAIGIFGVNIPQQEKLAQQNPAQLNNYQNNSSGSGEPYLSIVGANGPGGVITQTTFADPSINIHGYNLKDTNEIRLTVYNASKETLLNYLIHDSKGNLIRSEVDTSSFKNQISLMEKLDSSGEAKFSLPTTGAGIWYIVGQAGEINVNTFLVRSDNGVYLKNSSDKFIFWGQSLKTNRSISDGSVEIYSLQDQIKNIGTNNFDKDGIAQNNFEEKADIAIATIDGQINIIPIGLRYINSDFIDSWSASTVTKKYFTFTDRPFYHPGDTVYFKSVIRDDNDASYSVPSGNVTVKIYNGYRDPANKVFEQNYNISSSGSIDGQFIAPDVISAKSFYLTVSSSSDDSSVYGSTYFSVNFYRKPEYKLDMLVDKQEVISGDKINARFNGEYFFGEKIANQKIKYSLSSSNLDYYDYLNTTEIINYQYWYGTQIEGKTGTVVTDVNGQAFLSFDTRGLTEDGRDKVISIEATVDDGSGNPAFVRKNILLHAGRFSIYNKTNISTAKTKENFSLPIILKPVMDPANISKIGVIVKIHRENWVLASNQDQKFSNYVQEKEDLSDISGKTNDFGRATISFVPQKVGSYTLTAQARDEKGNLVVQKFNLYVSDKDVYLSDGQSGLTIKSDKQEYNPGDTAKIEINSIIADRDVFFSTERVGIRQFQIVHLNGKSASLDLSFIENDMPNIFASVNSFDRKQLDSDQTNLIVSSDSKKLSIDIEPNKTNFSPGETVSVKITTRNKSGKPVSANVTLWTVDKALFELTQTNLGNIFQTFWDVRYDRANSSNSLLGIYSEGGGKGGGGGEDGRTIFKDTSYWNPEIKTDQNGQAMVEFKLPDNLTTWSIVSVGETSDTIVGQNIKDIQVSKDFVIRPVLPNILRVGDKVDLKAIAQNFTSIDQNVVAQFSSSALKILNPVNSESILKAQQRNDFYWSVMADNENNVAKVTYDLISKIDNKKLDSVTQTIPVRPFNFIDQKSMAGIGEQSYSFDLNKDSLNSGTKINLSLGSSLIGNLPSAMDYLIQYPYGCNEQIASAIEPAIVAKSNQNLFKDAIGSNEIESIVKNGINKLVDGQNGSLWSWWKGQKTNYFVSAYIVDVLNQAKKSGFASSQKPLDSAKNSLKYKPDSLSPVDEVSWAYMSALLQTENRQNIVTFTNLSPDFLSMAVMTNYMNGDTNPDTNGMNELIKRAKTQGDGVFWDAGADNYFGSVDASTALAVRALTMAGGDKTLIRKAVTYLIRNRQNEYWSNTFATSQVIMATTSAVLGLNEDQPNYNYKISLNGKTLSEDKFTAVNQKLSLSVPVDKLNNGKNIIKISKDGAGEIYSSLVINESRTDKNASKISNNGLIIERHYEVEKNGSAKIGDTIKVKLTVSGLKTTEKYGVIEDKLPSGIIPIDESFDNESYNPDKVKTDPDALAGKVVTENGMILSLNQIDPGQTTYTYRARIVSAGEFNTPPATASLMYAPEINARTSSQIVKIDQKNGLAIPLSIDSGLSAITNRNTLIFTVGIICLILFGIVYFIIATKRKKF